MICFMRTKYLYKISGKLIQKENEKNFPKKLFKYWNIFSVNDKNLLEKIQKYWLLSSLLYTVYNLNVKIIETNRP
jgi:hypothetical protein